MSQEIREKALGAAVAVAGPLGDDAVVSAATKFAAFLMGGTAPAVTKPATKPVVEKAKPVTAAPAEKAKPVAAKPAAQVAAKPEINPDAKKMVGDKVNELLRANKREEAVALLASFEGAQSATGIVSQGEEVVQAFMAQADEILSAAAEGLAD